MSVTPKPHKHIFQICLCLGIFIILSGCVHYGQFRDDKPGSDLSHRAIWRPAGDAHYYLAFIEVDDFGEMYDHTQLTRALSLIQQAKNASPDGNARVITFIHGWKNNSSDKSGNVWGFRDALNDIAGLQERYAARRGLAAAPVEPTVGIYIGWRGAVTNAPILKEFTFWNRRDAATLIPGGHLTEILSDIMHETRLCLKSCTPSPQGGTAQESASLCVIVGHSFGGMVLERTLTQAVVGDILRQVAENKEAQKRHERARAIVPPADLIALVNEAAPATESKQFLDILKRYKIKVKIDGVDVPLFLSITSEGDTATGVALPIGQYATRFKRTMRTYDQPEPPELKSQSTYYAHSTAHLPPLFSHRIVLKGEPGSEALGARRSNCFVSHPLKREYCIEAVEGRWNDTPYWVMQMPREFVPDHSTIFRPVFRELLEQFLAPRVSATGATKPVNITIE